MDPIRSGKEIGLVHSDFATGFWQGRGTSHYWGSPRLGVTNKEDMHGNGKDRLAKNLRVIPHGL